MSKFLIGTGLALSICISVVIWLSKHSFETYSNFELKWSFPLYYEQDEKYFYFFRGKNLNYESSHTAVIVNFLTMLDGRHVAFIYNGNRRAALNLESRGYSRMNCPDVSENINFSDCFSLAGVNYYISDSVIVFSRETALLDWIGEE